MRKCLVFALVFTSFNGWSQYFENAIQVGTPGVTGASYSEYVTTDALGNVYNFGGFTETTDFDPGPAIDTVGTGVDGAMYFQKLDSLGNLVWYKIIERIDFAGHIYHGNGATIDDAGNILFIASFAATDTVDVDAGPGVFNLYPVGTGRNIFIAKYTSSGVFVWAKSFGGTGAFCYGQEVVTDAAGNVYATGSFCDTVDFDPGPGVFNMIAPSGPSFGDVFILKLDPAGNFVFAKRVGGDNHDWGFAIDVDVAGNIIAAGYYANTVDMDPGPGVYNVFGTPGAANGFVLKLNALGDFIWADVFLSSSMFVKDMQVDAVGDIYACGYFSGSVDFDPGAGTDSKTAIAQDAYVMKLNSSTGAKIYVNVIGDTAGSEYSSLYLEPDGTHYVVGMSFDDIDCDPGPATQLLGIYGFTNSLLQKFDAAGNMIWTTTGVGNVGNRVICVDIHHAVYIATSFQSVRDFDFGPGIFTMSAGYGWQGCLYKFGQGPCSPFTGVISAVSNPSCASPGLIAAHGINGTAPYAYSWDVLPVDTDSILTPDTAGMYTLSITDFNGCEDKEKILVDGPAIYTGFDLVANISPLSPHIGFNSNILVDGFNAGCTPVNGEMRVVLDTLVTYVSSTIPPDLISGDTLIWYLTAFDYDAGHINPVITINTPTYAVLGDTVVFSMTMTPPWGDVDFANNFKTVPIEVVNAYDPNIKSVYPQGVCPEHYTLPDQRMTYTVMFQNTGTAPAVNVMIWDKIDTLLDLSSLSVIASSHPVITQIEPGNNVKFKFNNIYLPDSTSDEQGSHGYVIYEVDQKPSLANGSVIDNTAHIYFDFNEAIVTNTVFNTISTVLPCSTIGVVENNKAGKLEAYPNPTNSIVTVKTENIAQKVLITDVFGRMIKTLDPNFTTTKVDLSEFANGVYFITVLNNGVKQTVKVIKS